MYTLVHSGTERSFQAWGVLLDAAFVFDHKVPCSAALSTKEPFDPSGSPQWGWGDFVQIWRDRTAVGSGGSLYFQGYVANIESSTDAGTELTRYTFKDWWWFAERNNFKQTRKQWNGWIGGNPANGPNLVDVVTPEVYLGETAAGPRQTNGAQVTEALNWLNTVFNPTRHPGGGPVDATQDAVQVGTVDPVVNMPVTRMQTCSVADAIIASARWSPDAMFLRDFTTSPPTVKWRSLANLPTASITLTANQERSISVAPQYDRQLPGVIVYYKVSGAVAGVGGATQYYTLYYVDIADGNGWQLLLNGAVIASSGSPPVITEYTPHVYSMHVELTGPSVSIIGAQVVTDSLVALLTGSPTYQKNWWLARDKTLQDPYVDSSSIVISNVTALDDSDVAINTTTYPYILLDTPVFSWMNIVGPTPVIWKRARVRASEAYTKHANTNLTSPDEIVQERLVEFRGMVTNAPSGFYVTPASFDTGDTVPRGVAAAVYASVKDLRYQGTVVFKDNTLRSDIQVGSNCTLVGPNHSFPKCVVQRLTTRPGLGETEAVFGPSATLDAPALIELARATRLRTTWAMPSARSSGVPSSSVAVSETDSKEDTQHGLTRKKRSGVYAPAT